MDWMKISLSDNASPIMEQLILFHDYSMLIIVSILSIVSFFMIKMMMMTNFFSTKILENQMLELIWTLIPTIVLSFIALPSLHLLYLMDEINNPLLTIKIIGHQWYWSYEYNDFNNLEFDSYMISPSIFRLLEVDNSTPIPVNCQTRLITTSSDVLHSWTIPAMGVKMDATPGRLNQISVYPSRSGKFFGQCSEICGANHSFMPIVLNVIPVKYFISWIKNFN
uniref:Cytochrome c oxidase subunit 2 n=1 Tax=Heteropsylla cubana TaxID=121849 RepID=A0A344A2D3_9HEMI|nr:cytochrome c oxidase subunit II [Heteropsylla sp. DMP-2018]AWU48924.1 cytochrome c oxidase subunit 2 [Heteropsylla sp. DMP-2018]